MLLYLNTKQYWQQLETSCLSYTRTINFLKYCGWIILGKCLKNQLLGIIEAQKKRVQHLNRLDQRTGNEKKM